MMQRGLIVLIIGVVLNLGGCACFTGYGAYPVISSPQANLLNKRITHLVKLDNGDETETFIAVLEIHADKTQLVGLTTTGITLFALDYTPAYQDLNTSMLYSDNIKPMLLLTELQLINFSAKDITRQLPENWNLEISGTQRSLSYKDRIRLVTTFFNNDTDSGTVSITNKADKHTLTITRLSVDDTQ